MLLADLPNPAPRTTRYFYGGESQWQVCEEQDGSGDTVATYVYGRYIDEVLQMQRCESTPPCTSTPPADYYYHTDDLYNVMAVTDDAGSVVERYEYDDYGTPMVMAPDGTVFASSTIGNPYLFTGRRYDAETSWYHYRTRYLDPAAGRFTTRDTIGIWGDPEEFGNGYTYVANSPLSWLDPFGLIPEHGRDIMIIEKAKRDEINEAGVPSGLRQRCASLLRRIKNIRKRIERRIGQLKENPEGLDECAPGDDQHPSRSRRGHRRLINQDKALLRTLEAIYMAICKDPGYKPFPIPVNRPAPDTKKERGPKTWEKIMVGPVVVAARSALWFRDKVLRPIGNAIRSADLERQLGGGCSLCP